MSMLALAILACGTLAPADEIQDIVFFDTRPIFLRLHVRVGDRGVHAVWREAVGRLYTHLDSNGDGLLAPEEVNRGGWLDQMRSQDPRAMRRGQPAQAVTNLAAEVRGPSELADLLRPFAGPFAVQNAAKSDDGTDTLFQQLDRDGDQKLSKPELEGAVPALSGLDEDEDEALRVQELRPYKNPFFGRGSAQPSSASPDSAPFALLGPSESRTKLTRRLLDQYDQGGPADSKEKDRKLSPQEIGLNEAVFQSADTDADGLLDADEIVRFLGAIAPGLELDVRTGKASEPRSSLSLTPSKGPTPELTAKARPTPGGGLALDLGAVGLDFQPVSGQQNQFDLREFYKTQFGATDTDRNKYIDKDESSRSNFFNGNTFTMMDRDGDGKLNETEVLSFVDRQQDLANSRTAFQYIDQGRSLFSLFDVNRDKRLSPRELHQAPAALSTHDHDGDARLTLDEVPRQFVLGFTATRSPVLIQFGVPDLFDANEGGPAAPAQGPRWFQKMDRNHDGDLSPGEFLGAHGDFRRLDADGDGLIDANEAARGK